MRGAGQRASAAASFRNPTITALYVLYGPGAASTLGANAVRVGSAP